MRFLAIGECMAEFGPPDPSGAYQMSFAGDTFNTAWYLARLCPDVDVSYFTAVGDDAISRQLLAFLERSEISGSHILTVPGKTIGLYLISVKDGERSFAYWREHSAARMLADDPQALDAAISGSDMVYFSGITLAILAEPARRRLLDSLGRARSGGKVVVFDPNLRPKLWHSTQDMTRVIMEAATVCDIALPSFEDEANYFNDCSPAETASRYAGAGAMTVVVKNGPQNVLYLEGNTTGEIPVEPLTSVVDTTAAGDSFNAGLLAGHALGLNLAGGIDLACQLARQVVQDRGALIPVRRDLCMA